MINKKFWKPSVTTQFTVCPIPYHMDTYRGCVYNCRYCFARDFVLFSRRNSDHKEFEYLEGNRADLLEKWIQRTLKKEYDYKKSEEVAFKERIPIKIGATSDPFPFVEKKERITFDILKVFEKYDYPLEIQTKNPEILADYAGEFDNPNWIVAVTMITSNEEFLKVCEPNAISAERRFVAIKRLTDLGIKVMVKIQPCIYPIIKDDLPNLIKKIKESGCWAFNTEGLKIRISMPKKEQDILSAIGDYIGINLREYYRNERKTGSDWELSYNKKLEYTTIADNLAKKYNLKYYVADNDVMCYGCGSECCGTEVLRDYRIFAQNYRTTCFGVSELKISKELPKCIVNFTRSKKYEGKTIGEVCEEYNKEIEQKCKVEQPDLFSMN